MKLKIAVYTAVFGGYEKVEAPSYVSTDVDYYAFTDIPIKTNIWRNIVISSDLDSTRAARKIKTLGHPILESYDYAIWVDGNIDIIGDIHQLIEAYDRAELITFKHPVRTCVYDEAEACINFMKDDTSIINRQVEFLRSEGYPCKNGLVESNVLIKKNSATVACVMETWWNIILKYSKRDQLSFNYSAFRHDFKYEVMGLENARGNSKFFEVRRDHESVRRIKFHFKKMLSKIKS